MEQLGQNRLQASQNFPGADFSETQLLTDMAVLAAKGNKQAQTNLIKTLENNVQIGQGLGILEQAPEAEQFTLSPGQRRFAGGREIARVDPTAPKPKDVQPQVNALRKDAFNVGKEFRTVEAANERIKAARDTAAGDLSLIFNFMKVLDPGSTVREGEFATAQNATGIDDRVRNIYNRAITGERLTTDQRSQFKGQADDLFQAQRTATDNQLENVLQQADQDDIQREKVLGTKRLAAFNQRAATRATSARQPAGVAPQTAGAPTAPTILRFDAQGNPI